MSDLMVYFFGTDDGKYIKPGKTSGSLASRKSSLESGQLTARVNLHLLAAVRAQGAFCETEIVGRNGKGGYFDSLRADVASTETFHAESELVEYVNWLRQQPWCWHSETEGPDDTPDFNQWRPTPERRIPTEVPECNLFGEDVRSYDPGPLSDTPWKFLSLPQPVHNDYYTPPTIVREAGEVMGGIDLDVASSWTANRIHKIPVYYTAHRSAFHNPWFGNVWMNPPYGDNGAWFSEAVRYLKSGDIKQICIFGQVSALVTQYARPLNEFRPSLLLFNPTPTFWGCSKSGEMVGPERCETVLGQRKDSKLGTDAPHGILYIGDRRKEFEEVFRERGFVWHNVSL